MYVYGRLLDVTLFCNVIVLSLKLVLHQKGFNHFNGSQFFGFTHMEYPVNKTESVVALSVILRFGLVV